MGQKLQEMRADLHGALRVRGRGVAFGSDTRVVGGATGCEV